ncbi:MAG: hypothetical protein JSU72_08420 [Deltaproteobacteria bacterium]|nr:MAG: hypothetical protein JSU72_08420 [Deltaproteobacteria bacterium]
MINPDITLLIQMINFLTLLFFLNLFLFRPIRKIINERNQIIDNFNKDIASMTEAAQESMDEFERKILQARKEGIVKVQEMKEEGDKAETTLIESTTKEIQGKIEEARNKVAADIQAARTQLQTQVHAFSLAVTEKILGRSVQ